MLCSLGCSDLGEACDALEGGEKAAEAGGLVIAGIEPCEFGDAVPLGAVLAVAELFRLAGGVRVFPFHHASLAVCWRPFGCRYLSLALLRAFPEAGFFSVTAFCTVLAFRLEAGFRGCRPPQGANGRVAVAATDV